MTIITVSLLIVPLLYYSPVVQDKLFPENEVTEMTSKGMRTIENLAMLAMFLERPVWGWGLGSRSQLYQFIQRDNIGCSNGILYMMSAWGLMWLIPFLIFTWKAICKFSMGISAVVILAIFLLLECNERYLELPISFLFLFYFKSYANHDMRCKRVKFSIVTVCYNSSATIGETILSVVNQTYPNVEYIVIDGDSTDGTQSIINKYKDKIAYYSSEPDKGVYDAMNKALKVATGDFLLFLGSDDHFMAYTILQDVSNLINDCDSVYYGNVFRNVRNDVYKGKFGKYKISLENICHQSIFYPKSVYQKYYYNTEYKIYADYYYNLLIYPLVSFKYLPLTIAYYNCKGLSSFSLDTNFECVVNSFVLRQNGFLAWFLRMLYLLYKKLL